MRGCDADQRNHSRRRSTSRSFSELGNSNQYIAIASYFEGECLFGLAKIYFKQAEEERDHAMKFVKFLLDSGGKVAIKEVAAVRNEFRSAEDACAERPRLGEADDRANLQPRDARDGGEELHHVEFPPVVRQRATGRGFDAETRLSVIKRAGPSVLMVEAYLAHQ